MNVAESVLVVVGHVLRDGVTGSDILAVNDTGNIERCRRLHPLDGGLKLLAVLGANFVVSLSKFGHRVSFWLMQREQIVTHHGLILDLGDLEGGELSSSHFERESE